MSAVTTANVRLPVVADEGPGSQEIAVGQGSRPREYWSLALALLMFGAISFGLGLSAYRSNDGQLIYGLDDAYIHMAIAKNVVRSGTFGIFPGEFSFASSSPLWTGILIATYFCTGALSPVPLILNLVFGAAAIIIVWRFARAAGVRGGWLALLLLACVFLTPLIPLVFTGMEHLLHLCLVVLLLEAVWRILQRDRPPRMRELWGFALVSALAVAARYETLFLVATIGLVLAYRRFYLAAFVEILSAAIVVGGLGWFSIAHGGQLLPNSVLLKGAFPSADRYLSIANALGYRALTGLLENNHMFVLMFCLVLMCWGAYAVGRKASTDTLLLVAVALAMVLHLQFAGTRWFYRYEAYMVASALVVIFIHACEWQRNVSRTILQQRTWASVGLFTAVVCVFMLPLVGRGVAAHFDTVRATNNIYQQQNQIALFLQRYYEGRTVAAHDVGAVGYLTDLDCLDLYGLGSNAVLSAKLKDEYSTDMIRRLVRDRKIPVVVAYKTWFYGDPPFPTEWILVGEWTIPNNVVCGFPTVSFFATSADEVEKLAESLRDFAPHLPKEVRWQERDPAPFSHLTPDQLGS